MSNDGDPLDVPVLMTNPTCPGILQEARPIALLKMKDTQVTDDRIFCVAVNDPRFASYKNVTDVEEHLLMEISHFFQVNKDLEGEKAMTIITAAINSCNKAFGKS